MKNIFPKIALFFLSVALLYSCSQVKRVPEGRHLLTKSEILVNNKKNNDEIITDQLYQKPNSTFILGFPLRLHLYNLAKPKPDSLYQLWLAKKPKRHKNLAKILSEKQVQRLEQSFLVSGFNNALKKNGEAPVVLDENKARKTKSRLTAYYFNRGYFNTKVNYKIDTLKNKRSAIQYQIKTGEAFSIDTVNALIETPALDSLFRKTQQLSYIKKGKQYESDDFALERKRISDYFRNNGAYKFQETNVNFDVDTLNGNHKANVDILIGNQTVKTGDSLITVPFKLYTISEVNIFTNNASTTTKNKIKVADSVTYKNFNLYSANKLNYRPKAITDAIFITKGSKFSDTKRQLTSKAISNLRIFNYPVIEYTEDKRDSTGNSLITNIYLTPRRKYSFNLSADFIHSNIQDFGITGSVGFSIRNVFRGAEVLDFSIRGNIGSSKDFAIANSQFFNISEYGSDAKLTFPRILSPINTERIIPKTMFPFTTLSFGISRQRNIGLDKENFTSILSYNWTPKKNNAVRFDLFNIQYVRNLNPDNYFYVYGSSYRRLNELAQQYNTNPAYVDTFGNLIIEEGTRGFTIDVLTGNTALTPNDADYKNIRSIEERRVRLTENNLIFASNFTYTKSSKTDLLDKSFSIFKTKLETAGNFLTLVSKLKKDPLNEDGNRNFWDLEYSQYVKSELDFIKHWELKKNTVLAIRSFIGIAIPYGNSDNIPFSRSYFGGGSNDNRGWQSYNLGPGSSGGINDFNEANMKLAFSAEYRFNMGGKWNAAFFADAGNIWNVLDNVKDPRYTFDGIDSLTEIALGTGMGIRYDFNFFVFRLDWGFKTYNPANEENRRWLKDMRFDKSVLNIGINYPF